MLGLKLNVPEEFRRGGRKEREEDSVRSRANLIRLVSENIRLPLEEAGLKGPADFADWYPERPLWRAVYSQEKATDLVAGTGWEIESLNDPEEDVQHYMICKPI